jgi:hypothetical protein
MTFAEMEIEDEGPRPDIEELIKGNASSDKSLVGSSMDCCD